MAALEAAIQNKAGTKEIMDGRVRPGHDGGFPYLGNIPW